MGILDFLKKKQEIKEEEIVYKNNLSNWINLKKQQHKEKEQEFLTPIKNKIAKLISELKAEITILEDVDIDAKKVDLRVKIIIKENLKNYLHYLEKMVERLAEVNKRENIIENINFIFEDFDKRSKLNYEKITFLVGKEMRATKESIRKFLKDLELILKANKESFEEFEAIGFLEVEIKKLTETEENKSEVSNILNGYFKKIEDLKRNLKNKEEEITEIKKSEKYAQEDKKKQELETKNKELQENTNNLGKSIDFKALSNFYHKFENERILVKEYRNNFKQIIEKEGTQKIEFLLKESKLNNEETLKLFNRRKEIIQKLTEIILEDTGVNFLEKSIEKVKSEINTINSEKKIKEKKLKTIEEDLDQVLNSIEDKLNKINIKFLENEETD